jgi:hypothetical protein
MISETGRSAGSGAGLLTGEQAKTYSEVALANVRREFPHLELVLLDAPEQPSRPFRALHPSFYGAFDWHSAVEMHWAMARLVRLNVPMTPRNDLLALLDEHLSLDRLAIERENLPRLECPYGYAWFLELAAEVERLPAATAGRWKEALAPLVKTVSAGFRAWVEASRYPVRNGLHANTAFCLSLGLDYARRLDPELATLLEEAARRWFGADRGWAAHFEPSGTDFLSPSLSEAELMAEVMTRDEFAAFLEVFLLPEDGQLPAALATPADPGPKADWYASHLHGLNLSRAHSLRRIAAALGPDDARSAGLEAAAAANAARSLGLVAGADYGLSHWLVAFALRCLTEGSPR